MIQRELHVFNSQEILDPYLAIDQHYSIVKPSADVSLSASSHGANSVKKQKRQM